MGFIMGFTMGDVYIYMFVHMIFQRSGAVNYIVFVHRNMKVSILNHSMMWFYRCVPFLHLFGGRNVYPQEFATCVSLLISIHHVHHLEDNKNTSILSFYIWLLWLIYHHSYLVTIMKYGGSECYSQIAHHGYFDHDYWDICYHHVFSILIIYSM